MDQDTKDKSGALDIIDDLRWFPFDLDKKTGAIRLVDIGPTWPRWENFFGTTKGDEPIPQRDLPAADAFKYAAGNAVPVKMNFLWHISYCCSTAILNALDVPGRNLSIFEPHILVSVAHARRQADWNRKGDIRWLSDATFRLLARPYRGGEPVLVKPAPVANYLIADAALKTTGKMLFLYSDCRSFLIASMRYGEHRRRYVRGLFRDIRRDGEGAGRWTADSVADLTDLEVAGLTWQLQIVRFKESLKRLGDRAASLDCDAFLADPKETIAKIWSFLELPGSPQDSALFQDPGFLDRHAKFSGESFAREGRLDEVKALDPKILQEIDRVVEASCDVFPEYRGVLPLPNALATVDKAYPR